VPLVGELGSIGPGDSGRTTASWISCECRFVVVESGAPHISHVLREAWFWKVHLGHSLAVSRLARTGDLASSGDCAVFAGRLWLGPLGRFDMAAIAALTTRTNGGFIPHARQGDKGVLAFAILGSKFDGTGFENEQIGQIHVALGSLAAACGVGADGLAGVPFLGEGADMARLFEPA